MHTARADAKSGSLKLFFVFFVDAVVAVVLLRVIFTSTNGMKTAAVHNLQAFVTRCFGAAFAPIRQAAGKRSDYVVGRAGVIFRAVRIGNLQNISRIL